MLDRDSESLLKDINSVGFEVYQCIDFLRKYTDSIGIHHFLIQKLLTYTYDELEFYIPQFIQLLVNYETNSMALEDFLFDYSNKFPHFCLVVFWNLQAYIFELRNDPESYSFQTVRKFINKLQNIMFSPDSAFDKSQDFRENLQPALIAMGSIAASFALPNNTMYSLPVIKSQARQQKAFVFRLANFQKALTRNLTMKNQRVSIDNPHDLEDDENIESNHIPGESYNSPRSTMNLKSSFDRQNRIPSRDVFDTSTDEERVSIDSPDTYHSRKLNEVEDTLKINTSIKSKKNLYLGMIGKSESSVYEEGNFINGAQSNGLSRSLPDLRETKKTSLDSCLSPTESETSLVYPHFSLNDKLREPDLKKAGSLSSHYSQQRSLYVNYVKKETDFIMSLQNISYRLSQIPKEARLSSLKAELSMINDNILPSEIDIPQLLPLTSHRNKRYHKILKMNVNEACVLNSAERVPFLLLVEYLSDEFDFDPLSEYNQRSQEFTLTRSVSPLTPVLNEGNPKVQSPRHPGVSGYSEEADLGDIGSANISLQDLSKLKLVSRSEKSDETNSPSLLSSGDASSKALASQMRIASVMLQQLEDSGKSGTEQSVSIRNRIIESMISLQDQFDAINYEKLNELKGNKPDAGERKLENDFKLGEEWSLKKARIKKSSIYGHLKNWDLCSVIAKNGDDLPQEAFACQLIIIVSNIWKSKHIQTWTKRMRILVTSANTGLVETIINAISIHSIKKSLTEHSIAKGDNNKGRIFTLLDYFSKLFGSSSSMKYRHAQENFARSLASYSILSYVFQIKDRHNGNIMIDNDGHIIHIDFGFILSNSPGSLGFEAAPFKLTLEYVELMGGQDSPCFKMFVDICKQSFKALREESNKIVGIVELMQKESSLPCFNNGENTSVLLEQRLQLHLTDNECDTFVENSLIFKSLGSMYTRLYDQFQMITQGIYS